MQAMGVSLVHSCKVITIIGYVLRMIALAQVAREPTSASVQCSLTDIIRFVNSIFCSPSLRHLERPSYAILLRNRDIYSRSSPRRDKFGTLHCVSSMAKFIDHSCVSFLSVEGYGGTIPALRHHFVKLLSTSRHN